MLERLSEPVRECLVLAAEAKARADETDNPALKAQHLEMERRWLRIAGSFGFAESLDDFTAANATTRRSLDEHLLAAAGLEPARHERRENLRWLASIVESSDDAIVGRSLDGVIMSWNKGAERVFGFAAEETIGQPVTILIPPDRYDEEPFILEQIMRGERIDHYETVRRRKDGSLIDISVCISPVRNDQGTIIGASKIARDITRRKQTDKQVAVLAREAEHRTRNILATVSATVELSESDTPEGLKAAIRGRIQALANVHALFVESRWTGADLHQLVVRELSPYCQSAGDRARIEGPKIVLDPSVAQALAVTLHELATNAAKYGSLSNPGGRLQITWSRDDALALRWSESDGPPVQAPTRSGFGRRVIETMIKQLGGTIDFDWRQHGLVFEVVLPREQA
jgi:PAS domain S-box-containing protein